MIHATEDEYVGVWLNQTQDSKWKYCPILHRFPSSIVRSSPDHFAISEHMLTNEDVAEPGALTEIFLESAVLELSKCGTLENPASFTNPTILLSLAQKAINVRFISMSNIRRFL